MKKYMPLEGLRWSRDSGSALYDTPQTAVLGRAGGAIIRRFALFPLMLLMLLLLPAGMVAQKAASSSKYIATYESSTQTLTFKKLVGETLPENSAWVEDGTTVGAINEKLGNGTIVHIVFDKSFSTYTPTSLRSFFKNLRKLETITGLEYLNTEKVTEMNNMFAFCLKLTSLDVTNFNTKKVINMERMFADCKALTSLDVTNFNTVNVKNMMRMFTACKALTSLDVTNFNSENVTNMSYMFYNCSKLTSLDVTNFNTEKVTNMSFMFSGCSTLTTIYVNDKFVIDKVTNGSYMFDNCTNLKDYAPSKKDHNYANYKTGYFTKLVGKNGDEKIGATGETLTTDNLVLDDDKDFVAYEPFAAKAASYSRKMKEGTAWATLCLPFEVSLENQNFRAFKLLSADDVTETVELEEIEGSIAAGTPVIIKMKDGATKLDFTVANMEIAKDVQTAETADANYKLQGIYTKKEFSKDTDNNCYIVKGAKLMNPAKLLDKTTTESVGSKPFRAYMVDNSSAPAAGARMFSISVGGSTTAIEQLESTADSKAEYYDLQGRRLQNLQKGINIVKRGGNAHQRRPRRHRQVRQGGCSAGRVLRQGRSPGDPAGRR